MNDIPNASPEILFHPFCPIAGLTLALRREAGRALRAQHLPTDERKTLHILLVTRALPIALDLLQQEKSLWNLARLEFDGLDIQLQRQPEQDDLFAFARHSIDSSSLQVFFIEKRHLPKGSFVQLTESTYEKQAAIAEQHAFAQLTYFLTERGSEEPIDESHVVIRRFNFNQKPQKTRPGRG